MHSKLTFNMEQLYWQQKVPATLVVETMHVHFSAFVDMLYCVAHRFIKTPVRGGRYAPTIIWSLFLPFS